MEEAIADLSSSSSSTSISSSSSISFEEADDDDTTAVKSKSQSTPKTHFQLYENQINDRVLQSEKVEAPKVSSNDDYDYNDHDRQLQLLQPDIVPWKYLQDLMNNIDDHDHDYDHSSTSKLFELYRKFENTGGYMIVELDDDDNYSNDDDDDNTNSDVSIVEDMWSTMEDFFSLSETSKMVDTQIVGIKNGGYNFIRTYMNRQGYILPETIQETLERGGGNTAIDTDSKKSNQYDNGIKGSNKLFATMAKTVGILTMAGSSSSSSSSSIPFCNKIISSLLDDKQQQFVNAEHRLSQYIIGNENEQKEESTSNQEKQKESLRSHTDWTVTTCIPLSSIPGLQIYKPKTNEWIIPELLLKGRGRTKYVIVMAGNWIELLTNQKIISCVHRVVNPTTTTSTNKNNNSNRRLSAPYFLRPKRYIFDMMQEVFNNENEKNDIGDDSLHWKPTTATTTTTTSIANDIDITAATDTAIDEMCYIFDMYVQFMKGNRNPNIPDYLFDIYINNDDDDEPKCYTIEDIL